MNILKKIGIGVVLILTSMFANAEFKNLSAEQKKCLTEVAYHETRGESLQGMVATIFVVLNRVKDSRFPNTPCSVMLQRGQFAFVGKGYTVKEPELYERSKAVVRDVLNGKHVDYSRGAIFFNSHHKTPVKGAVCTTRIGGHSFYKKDVK